MTDTAPADRVVDIVDAILDCDLVELDRSFADLGGDSIQAVQVLASCARELQVTLPLDALTPRTTIAELILAVSAAARTRPGASTARLAGETGAWTRAAPRQEALYLIGREAPDSPMYNVPVALWLTGDVAPERLMDCVAQLLVRQKALRGVFRLSDEGVIETTTLPATDLDWRLPAVAGPVGSREAAQRWIEDAARVPLNLDRGAFRAGLLAVADGEYALVLIIHHAVCDGWALNLLLRDLASLYRGDAPATLVGTEGGAARAAETLTSGVIAELTGQWSDLLRGAPEALDLPVDGPRAPVRGTAGARIPLHVDGDSLAALRSRSAELGTTPFVVLLTAFGLLLHRYTGQDDFVVGVPLANRYDTDAQEAVGYFSNTVPVRVDLRTHLTLREAVDRASAMLGASTRLAALPLDAITSGLGRSRPSDRTPVFQVALVLLTNDPDAWELPGITVRREDLGTRTAKFDQCWYLEERHGELTGYVEYAAALFHPATVERMRNHFDRLVAAVLGADPDAPVATLSVFTAGEEARMIDELSPAAPGRPGTVIDRFLDHVREHPGDPAIWCEGETVSYGVLFERARATADRLAAEGVGPESLVGVCVPRSVQQVADWLGVLLAGAAFLSLDPAYPVPRLRYMVEDSGAACLVLGAGLEHLFEDMPVKTMRSGDPAPEGPGRPVPVAVAPKSLAYVIYTSGSTGTPKGVDLTHDGLVNLVDNAKADLGLVRGTRVFQFVSISFDVSVMDIFMTLGTGGTLCLGPADINRLDRPIHDYINMSGAEVMFLTPAVLGIVDPATTPSIRTVISGGDRIGAELVHRWSPVAGFFAVYGPTEGTILQTWGRYDADLDGQTPIGRPLGGIRLYVLDNDLQPVPYGAIGEVYVGGLAVGRGYRRRPALTASLFLPDPFSPSPGGDRMYRTGDLVRRRSDGEMTFVGRRDNQVKVRGFRIELGEVQAALSRMDSVTEAVAVVDTNPRGQNRLVGYVVAATQLSEANVRERLRRLVPEQLVPSRVIQVAGFPRTLNGKIDYAALRPVDEPASDELTALLDRLDELTEDEAAGLLAELDGATSGES